METPNNLVLKLLLLLKIGVKIHFVRREEEEKDAV